jgi:hypothetical protein
VRSNLLPQLLLRLRMSSKEDKWPRKPAHRDVQICKEHLIKRLKQLLARDTTITNSSMHSHNRRLSSSLLSPQKRRSMRAVVPARPSRFKGVQLAVRAKREELACPEPRYPALDDSAEDRFTSWDQGKEAGFEITA